MLIVSKYQYTYFHITTLIATILTHVAITSGNAVHSHYDNTHSTRPNDSEGSYAFKRILAILMNTVSHYLYNCYLRGRLSYHDVFSDKPKQ